MKFIKKKKEVDFMKNLSVCEKKMLEKMEKEYESDLRMVMRLLDDGMRIFGNADEAIEYTKRTMYIKSLAVEDIKNPWNDKDMRDYLSHYYE